MKTDLSRDIVDAFRERLQVGAQLEVLKVGLWSLELTYVNCLRVSISVTLDLG